MAEGGLIQGVEAPEDRMAAPEAGGIWESDWLASSPVFYNDATGKVSRNINDVIDYRNLEFDPEGLNNFLDFGYSVFGQTPVRHVKFLRHSSRLTAAGAGSLRIETLPDPVELRIGRAASEDEVLDLLRDRIQRWELSVRGDIVVPTSGGNDSRLLNLMLRDRKRIRSFTYGYSDDQSRCIEVVYARKFCEIAGIRWEQVELGGFLAYIDEWDELFGCSTHCHGMYQMEFYRKIRERTGGGLPLLSGIIGDAWAGSVNIGAIDDPSKVRLLGYTHGASADSRWSRMRSRGDLMEDYYRTHREKLADPAWRVVEAMRFKLLMLCYLFRVPKQLGFEPWSPFLDLDIAMGMLGLPAERRKTRLWQTEFFRRQGVEVEIMGLPVDVKNTIGKRGVFECPLRPLDSSRLSEIVDPRYVRWVNRKIKRTRLTLAAVDGGRSIYNRVFKIPKVGGLLWKVGLRDTEDHFDRHYYAYLTLRALDNALIRRDNA